MTQPDPLVAVAHSEQEGPADSRSDFIDEAKRRAEELRKVGREAIGVGGVEDRRSLRQVMREDNLSLYPLIALVGLAVGDLLNSQASGAVAPDIARTFGLTPLFFNLVGLFTSVTSTIVPILVARYVQNRARRALVLLVSTSLFALTTPMTGVAVSVWMLVLIMVFDSVTTSASGTVNASLMIDLHPPQVRVRAMATLFSASQLAQILVIGIILLMTGPLDLNWRGVFVGCGVLAVVSVIFALGLRDPGYGTYDTERLRALAKGSMAESDGPAAAPGPGQEDLAPEYALDETAVDHEAGGTRLTLVEAARRIMAIKTMRVSIVAMMAGMMAGPLQTYLAFVYADRFNLDAFQRSLFSGATLVVGLLSYIVLAPIGDRIYQRDPARIYLYSGLLGIVGSIAGAAQFYVTSLEVTIGISLASAALSGLMGPAMMVGSMSVVPAPLRPHVGAVFSFASLLAQGVATAVLGGVSSKFGFTPAVTIVTIIEIIAAIIGIVAGLSMSDALDDMVTEVIEDEVVGGARRREGGIPMLAAREIDFFYGQTQVLFGVDFHVEEGEMVSLLGVNGSGKSTLLKVISGIGLPCHGSVRLAGDDITYVGAARRARLGITQVPGGRSVFGELTVLENLRTYGYSTRRRRAELECRIDDAFEAFPRLAERRSTRAGQLSGGEQQMLGLAKAYIMQPKILLIDELSLGLAPLVVEQLIGMVGAINERGTAVVVVEQSVDLALSITTRSYFLERGQVMFTGPSGDLLEQTGLLRSVFLSGFAGVDR